jgi:hypothetical protein
VQRPLRFRPQLTWLEDRTLPSTFLVQNLNDSGPHSLRAAIAAANANPGSDAIAFAGGLHGTITLTSGELLISDSVTVSGPGANTLTVSGKGANRIFEVASGLKVTLVGLTIANGLADTAGGIDNFGSLTIGQCVVSNNHALGDSPTSGVGGGLVNEPGANLTLDHCLFTGNQAVGNQGLGYGGGLMNAGSAVVTGSTFRANQATGGSSGSGDGGFGSGGGISSFGTTLTIENSTFTTNQVSDGGGLFASGGAVDIETGTMSLRNSSFIANRAVANNPATLGAFGAGLASGEAAGGTSFQVSDCLFSENVAQGLIAAAAGAIGTFLCQGTISDTSFIGNKVLGVAGAEADGGAIQNALSTLTVSGCTFLGNLNQGGDGTASASAGPAFGGAILSFDAGSSSLTLTNTTFLFNQDVGGNGGSSRPGGEAGAGAVYLFGGSVVNCTFIGNQARAGSGTTGALAFGGALTARGAPVTVQNSTFIGNQALGGAGEAGGNGGNAYGGAMDLLEASFSVSDSTFLNNAAEGGAGDGNGNGGNAHGGAVVLQKASLNLSNSSLTGNEAEGGAGGSQSGADGAGLGGGAYNDAASTLVLAKSVVTLNQANGSPGIGGGVYNLGAFTFDALTVIAGNHASTSGDDLGP